jgi:hypothetical protein
MGPADKILEAFGSRRAKVRLDEEPLQLEDLTKLAEGILNRTPHTTAPRALRVKDEEIFMELLDNGRLIRLKLQTNPPVAFIESYEVEAVRVVITIAEENVEDTYVNRFIRGLPIYITEHPFIISGTLDDKPATGLILNTSLEKALYILKEATRASLQQLRKTGRLPNLKVQLEGLYLSLEVLS